MKLIQHNKELFISAIIVGGMFVVFVRSDILRKIPGFYCEGFGCMGLGIVYMMLALLIIPLTFGLCGFIFSKEKRIQKALFSLSVSLAVMIWSVWIIRTMHRFEVQKAIEQDRKFIEEFNHQRSVDTYGNAVY
jgi:ABC-type Na+ efflux pump permease subunit